MFTLRPYQQEAVDAWWKYWERGGKGNPLLVLPTGAGKSIVQAALVHSILERFPQTKILLLTHVKELIEQNAEKLRAYFGDKVGVYSAGLGEKVLDRPITVAGVQSIVNRRFEIEPNLIFIDECHRVPDKGNGQYRKLLEAVTSTNPNVRVTGLSATPFRTKSGWLHKGKSRIFTDVIVDVDVAGLIEQGYLSQLRSKAGVAEPDVSGVKVRAGEFAKRELETVMTDRGLVQAAIKESLSLGEGRKKWLLFCSGLKHAGMVLEELSSHGVSAVGVYGNTPQSERDEHIRAFKAGEVQALVNVNVLTTGFDAPDIDCLVMLRPTQSPGLYCQMVGRGLRIAEGKRDCLVLDFSGNIERHGPIDKIEVREARNGPKAGKAPVKVCQECREVTHLSAKECSACGAPFPERKIANHNSRADGRAIVGPNEPNFRTHNVTEHRFIRRVGKKGPYLRVEYQCGLRCFHENVFFESKNAWAQKKARHWWKEHIGTDVPVPNTVDEAIKASCWAFMPEEIEVNHATKWNDVTAKRFRGEDWR